MSAQWKRLPTSTESPPARAYHSLTYIGSRYLLFGGFDGKSTFGDIWWLVPEGTDLVSYISLIPCSFYIMAFYFTWMTFSIFGCTNLILLGFRSIVKGSAGVDIDLGFTSCTCLQKRLY